jgi:hypothetical protein
VGGKFASTRLGNRRGRCRSGAARCGQSLGRRVRRRGRSGCLAVACPKEQPYGEGRRYRPGRGRRADPARAVDGYRPPAIHALTPRFSLKLAALGVAPDGPRVSAILPVHKGILARSGLKRTTLHGVRGRVLVPRQEFGHGDVGRRGYRDIAPVGPVAHLPTTVRSPSRTAALPVGVLFRHKRTSSFALVVRR